MLINAENKTMGRLASFAAKKAMDGESITIVNAEKAVVSGTKQDAIRRIRRKLDLRGKGNPEKGPKFSRMPDKVLRMAIRGMLPWKSSRGKEVYRRIHVYIGLPEEFQGKEFEKTPEGKPVKKFVKLGEICELLGAKW